MGNNIVSSVMKVFDRNHSEIESISARIDRAQIKGLREKHEIYVENIGLYQPSSVHFATSRNNVNQVTNFETEIGYLVCKRISVKMINKTYCGT